MMTKGMATPQNRERTLRSMPSLYDLPSSLNIAPTLRRYCDVFVIGIPFPMGLWLYYSISAGVAQGGGGGFTHTNSRRIYFTNLLTKLFSSDIIPIQV